MKNRHPLVWLIPLILLLMLVPFVVPSALPYAGAETADLPVYSPVDLANPHPDPLPMPSAKEQTPPPYAPHPDGFVYDEATGAAWEYRDGTIYVKIETRVINETKVYFTWIQIADASQLRTKVTAYETAPDKLAKVTRAVLAINGDWYSGRSEGIIYRNANLMRPARPFRNYDALIIDDEGNFHILYRPADDAFAPYEGSILHSFLFGPALVINGELQTFDGNNYGSGAGMGLPVNAQRQCICQMGKLSYLIITTEGPDDKQDKVHGFNIPQFAQLAYDMGAINAYNLDGGNSACLLLNGVKMNRFGKSGMRPVTDILYFITAEPAPEPELTDAPSTETEGSSAP